MSFIRKLCSGLSVVPIHTFNFQKNNSITLQYNAQSKRQVVWQGFKDFFVQNMLQMVQGGTGAGAKKDFTEDPVCLLKSRDPHKGCLNGILKSG